MIPPAFVVAEGEAEGVRFAHPFHERGTVQRRREAPPLGCAGASIAR
jgi:hypothetical protein